MSDLTSLSMKRHSLAPPLAAVLLLGTLGCSKKDEPVPIASTLITGSYKLDGQLVTCQAKAFEYPNRTGFYQDQLQIQLNTVSTSGSIDNLLLSFSKGISSPLSTYYFDGVLHMTRSSSNASLQTRSYLSNASFTLVATAGGGYSGLAHSLLSAPALAASLLVS